MEEQKDLEKQDKSQAIFWTALTLTAFALFVAALPFFYLKDVIIG